MLVCWALQADIDPRYCACIAEHESGFQVDAVGAAGERGFLQILPSTGEWFAKEAGLPWDEERLEDPEYSWTLFVWAQQNGHQEMWSTHDLCIVSEDP
jgi:soluble lytic murein transglycosylase